MRWMSFNITQSYTRRIIYLTFSSLINMFTTGRRYQVCDRWSSDTSLMSPPSDYIGYTAAIGSPLSAPGRMNSVPVYESTPMVVRFVEPMTPINHLSSIADEPVDDATLVRIAESIEDGEEVAACVAAFLYDEEMKQQKMNKTIRACKRRLFMDDDEEDDIDVFFKKMKFF